MYVVSPYVQWRHFPRLWPKIAVFSQLLPWLSAARLDKQWDEVALGRQGQPCPLDSPVCSHRSVDVPLAPADPLRELLLVYFHFGEIF